MIHTLTVGKTNISYRVRYSPKAIRKRIIVTPAGVELVAPKGASWDGPNGLLAYIHRKRRWVFDSVREIDEKHRKLLTQRYESGAKLQYRGRWLMLDVQPGPITQVEIKCRSKFHVVVPKDLPKVQRLEATQTAFDDWLLGRAKRDLVRFGRHHEEELGVKAKSYHLSQTRTRWGSCGRDDVIRIHWRLIQAPKPAFEYVVAHEVAHLFHRNHSPEFWNKLEETLPNWTEAKAMLEAWEGAHRAV